MANESGLAWDGHDVDGSSGAEALNSFDPHSVRVDDEIEALGIEATYNASQLAPAVSEPREAWSEESSTSPEERLRRIDLLLTDGSPVEPTADLLDEGEADSQAWLGLASSRFA